jgi:Cu2+-containing amine oxidase
VRMGSVRNYPWKYDFANHDFWVTRRNLGHKRFSDVPLYATYGRPVDKTPMTVWHSSASLHVPRGEDYGPDGVSSDSGAAVATWAECLLKPVNLFDGTPMYPAAQKKADVQKK